MGYMRSLNFSKTDSIGTDSNSVSNGVENKRTISSRMSNRTSSRMINSRRTGSASIFTSWLISYLTILLIPVIISGFVYYNTSNIIKNEITRANTAILRQVVQVIDGGMQEIWNLCLQLAFNDKISALRYIKKPFENVERYNISRVVRNEMTLSKAISSFINSYYIYFRNGDFVLRPGGYYEPKVAYMDFHENSNLSYEDWFDMMQQKYYKACISVGANYTYAEDGEILAFIHTYPIEGEKIDANFVFFINEKYLNNIIQNMEWIRKGTFMIIDKSDNVLVSNTSDNISVNLKYQDLGKDNDIIFTRINGESIVISYVSSKLMDWKYISVFPASVFMERASYARKITVNSLIFCMLVGIVLAYFYSKKNYNPISELIMLLIGKSKIKEQASVLTFKNEYKFITEAVKNTLEEKEKYAKILELQEKEMRQSFLQRLLRGKVSSVSIDDIANSYDIDIKSGKFAVMLFQIENCMSYFEYEKAKNLNSSIDMNIIEHAVINLSTQLISKNRKCYTTEINGMIACIINFKNMDIEECRKELTNIAEKLRDLIKENLSIVLTVAISDVHETYVGINQAYQEALEAIEYRMIIGSGEIICYDEVVKSSYIYDYSIETELQLINNIKIGDFEKAKKILDDIFNKNFKNNSLSLEMARCFVFDLTSTIIKTFYEICGNLDNNLDSSLWDNINPIENLFRHQTVVEMKERMEDILRQVCMHIEKRKESHNKKLKDDIINYIKKNYNNSNLSNSMIAGEFGINPAYLSRFFKEQTGEGILDYIHKLRLEKAKELLKTEKTTIDDIANRVGYYNSIALIRAFKKYEGITPGKYKEIQGISG